MASYVSTSILVTVQMLDSAGSSVYAGASNGLYVWGAQLELADNYQDLRNDIDNYRYVRGRGLVSTGYYLRTGTDNNTDQIGMLDRSPLNIKLRAHKAGTYRDTLININNTERTWAPQTLELLPGVRSSTTSTSAIGRRWFQLAPYYNSYIHRTDTPTDPLDNVYVGSPIPVKVSGGLESVAFYQIPKISSDGVSSTDTKPTNFYQKNFYETKTIPRIPKYDAAQVMEVFVNFKSARTISSSNYITLSGDYTYYRANNWFSPLPNTRWSRFAFGSGDGLGPQIREVFDLGDTLSFVQTYKLPPDYFIPTERIYNQLNLTAKLAIVRDIYTKTGNYTSSNAAQTTDVFVNYKDGTWFGRAWFRLAPYYNSYTHTVYPPTSLDLILQSDLLRRDVAQDLYNPVLTSTEDYQTVSGAEDYQILPT